jgi:hypothetical protein
MNKQDRTPMLCENFMTSHEFVLLSLLSVNFLETLSSGAKIKKLHLAMTNVKLGNVYKASREKKSGLREQLE